MNNLLGIRGYLIDAPQPGKLRVWSDGAILVEDGLIAEVGDYAVIHKKPRKEDIRWIHSAQVAVFPGLIDLHTHLPQHPMVARGNSELLPWLKQYIFPAERDFSWSRSKRESPRFFEEMARCGTTTAMVYGSMLEESCDAAFAAAEKSGMRVILGKILMDTGPGVDTRYPKAVGVQLQESARLCKKWHGAGNGLLEYAFSPRFALSCSDDLMRGAADLAGSHSAYIQTHLSENLEEIEKVRAQFPWAGDYTEVYEKCGLLGPRTVLGHCVHLSEREKESLAATRSNVAHCPTSNLFLGSGIMPLDQFMDYGIHTGLGSDVAAGPELNLWQVMRSTIECQKARSFFEKNVRIPSPADVLFLATRGAADALGKGDLIGGLEIGREADLTVVDFGSLLPGLKSSKILADLSAEDILSLCIYRGGPRATVETFVRGQSVYRALNPGLF